MHDTRTDDADDRFRAFRVHRDDDGGVRRGVETVGDEVLPEHDVTVRVRWSALNYKDALSASGNRGVTRRYPHTPGIDAAGTVTASRDPRFAVGDEVVVTSYDLGMNTAGGFGQRIRVPGDWVVPLPEGLDLREAMVLGTAGLTAGLSVRALQDAGVGADAGPVVVSGASGGVGSLAVAILARLGYEVVAGTGSPGAHDLLRRLGATGIVDRRELAESGDRPLLEGRWAGAVDTVGGSTLETLIRSLRPRGAVAACGLVQGPELRLTVYPFILRGVALLGIDSAECPMPLRGDVWTRLAGDWKPAVLDALAHEIGLDGLDEAIDTILAGGTTGRLVVRL